MPGLYPAPWIRMSRRVSGNPALMADLAVELMRHGYLALPRVWARSEDDTTYVATRLLARRAHVVRGEDAARLFYDETVVQRSGAVPRPLANVLFGRGAVHGLDGPRHRERKQLFLDALDRQRADDLGEQVARELTDSILSWPERTPVSLFDELVR